VASKINFEPKIKGGATDLRNQVIVDEQPRELTAEASEQSLFRKLRLLTPRLFLFPAGIERDYRLLEWNVEMRHVRIAFTYKKKSDFFEKASLFMQRIEITSALGDHKIGFGQ
jgi:hypothetical protein